MKNCRIVFGSLNNTYLPGQAVNGHVEYSLDTPKKLIGIRVEFRGFAETKWTTDEEDETKKSDGTPKDTTVVHSATEEYFKIANYIYGTKNGAVLTLYPGVHRYDFNFILPSSLPSSFDGKYGFVRYTVAITREEPYTSQQDISVPFTVVNFFDLNMDSKYRMPIALKIKKTLCCLWCKSGPVIVELNLPASGYYPGQTVPVDISCENGSSATISEIKVKLKKVITFHFETPSKDKQTKSDKIAKLSFGNVLANSTKNFDQTFQLPTALSSNALDNCGIIDMNYVLQVQIFFDGCHIVKEKEIPFTIGNAPQTGYGISQQPANVNKSITEQTPLFASAPDESPAVNLSQPAFNPMMNFPSPVSMPQPYYSPANPPYPTGNLPYPSVGFPPYPSATNPPYPTNAPTASPISPSGWNPHTPYPLTDKHLK